jgi:hypothetical protein
MKQKPDKKMSPEVEEFYVMRIADLLSKTELLQLMPNESMQQYALLALMQRKSACVD